MNSIDLITILGNISQALYPVQYLISGGAYLLGIIFVLTAISKLRKIADYRAQSSSHERMYSPLMYLLVGACFIYLPTAFNVMANTAFGVGNVLTYSPPSTPSIYYTMGLFIRTAGGLWFIRGCVLIVHSSEPGTQHGPKGLAFICAGILAMNFDNTIAIINYILNGLMSMSLAIKSSQGY